MTPPPATPPLTNAEHLAAWRAAVLAYRRVRQRGELDHPARLATVAACLEVWPPRWPGASGSRSVRSWAGGG